MGWVAVALAVAGFVLAMRSGRERLSRRGLDVVLAATGVCAAIGGLLIVGDVDTWSWIVAPVALAVGAVAQERALFAPGGPFRT